MFKTNHFWNKKKKKGIKILILISKYETFAAIFNRKQNSKFFWTKSPILNWLENIKYETKFTLPSDTNIVYWLFHFLSIGRSIYMYITAKHEPFETTCLKLLTWTKLLVMRHYILQILDRFSSQLYIGSYSILYCVNCKSHVKSHAKDMYLKGHSGVYCAHTRAIHF